MLLHHFPDDLKLHSNLEHSSLKLQQSLRNSVWQSNAPTETTQQIDQDKLDSNYFKRANTAFRKSLVLGKYEQGVTLDQISDNDKAGLFTKIIDFFKEPKAAVSWIGTYLMDKFAGSWAGELFGLTKKLEGLKSSITEGIKTPYLQSRKALEDLSKSSLFKGKNIKSVAALKNNLSSILDNNDTPENRFTQSLVKLDTYLADNPSISANSSEEERKSPEFWLKILDNAEIQEEFNDEIIDIMLGQKTVDQVLHSLFSAERALDPNAENSIQKRETVNWTDNEFRDRLNKYHNVLQNDKGLENAPYSVRLFSTKQQIEAQYFVDKSRLRYSEVSTTIQKFEEEYGGLLKLAGVIAIAKNPTMLATNKIPALLKLPFKIGPVKIGILALTVFLLHKYLNNNPYLPHKLDELQEELKKNFDKILQSAPPIAGVDLNEVRASMDNSIKLLFGDESINITPKDLANQIYDTVRNTVTTTPEKLVEDRNKNLVKAALLELRQKQNEATQSTSNTLGVLTEVIRLLEVLDQSQKELSIKDIKTLQDALKSTGHSLELSQDSAFYMLEGPLFTNKNIPLVINPDLPKQDKIKIARDYKIYNSNLWSASAEAAIDNFRLGLSSFIIFQDGSVATLVNGVIHKYGKGYLDILKAIGNLNQDISVQAYDLINSTTETIGGALIITAPIGIYKGFKNKSMWSFAGSIVSPISKPIAITASMLNPRYLLSSTYRYKVNTKNFTNPIESLVGKFNNYTGKGGEVLTALGKRHHLVDLDKLLKKNKYSKGVDLTKFQQDAAGLLKKLGLDEAIAKTLNSPHAITEFRHRVLYEVVTGKEYKGVMSSIWGNLKHSVQPVQKVATQTAKLAKQGAQHGLKAVKTGSKAAAEGVAKGAKAAAQVIRRAL